MSGPVLLRTGRDASRRQLEDGDREAHGEDPSMASRSAEGQPRTLTHGSVLAMQRTVGNAATARHLARASQPDACAPEGSPEAGARAPGRAAVAGRATPGQRVLQRDPLVPAPSSAVATEEGKGAAGKALPAPRNEIELIGSRLKGRQVDLASFLKAATEDVKAVRGYFKLVDGVYRRSHGNHELVIKQGDAEAQTDQAWLDFANGVAIGIAVGLFSEAIIAERAAKTAWEGVAEVGAEMVEGGIGSQLKTDVPRPSLVAELSPAMKGLEALKRLDDFSAGVMDMAVPGTYVFSDPIAQSERLSAELRVMEAGGQPRMSEDDIRQGFLRLMRFELESLKLEVALKAAEAKFAAFRTLYTSKAQPSDQECEQAIWILWIAAQSGEAPRSVFARHVLERPVIANHFVDIGLAARGGRGGRLNADIENSAGALTDKDGHLKGSFSPWIQLLLGARAEVPKVETYWRGVFLAE